MQNPKKKTKKNRGGAERPTDAYRDGGYVVLNASRVEELRIREGLSVRQFAELADVSGNTASRFFREQRIQWKIARRLFDNLGIDDMRPYLRNRAAEGMAAGEARDDNILCEWRVLSTMSQPTALSNGLEFQLYKLEHSVLPHTFGRGKCYDLRELRSRDRERVQEQLLRHPMVCRRVFPDSRFPVNERVLYSESHDRFWVIDRWFDGISLADKLRYGPLPAQLLVTTMRQIMEGLATMHRQQIIRRELSPRYVALTEPHGDVLLTELELAKLLDGVISVSSSWEEDPYRAPEVEAAEIDTTVDFYSWAQILVHAITGRVPPSPADPTLLTTVNLPSAIRAIAERCLSTSRRFRPNSASQILKILGDWKT